MAIVPVNAQRDCPTTCAARGHAAVTGDMPGRALCRKKLASGQAFLGTWSQGSRGCEYVDAGQAYRSTAAGEAYDCVCAMAAAPLEWAPALGCMDGGGAAIRDAAPPACRVWNGATQEWRLGWMKGSADGATGTCYYPSEPATAKSAVLQRAGGPLNVEVLCKAGAWQGGAGMGVEVQRRCARFTDAECLHVPNALPPMLPMPPRPVCDSLLPNYVFYK